MVSSIPYNNRSPRRTLVPLVPLSRSCERTASSHRLGTAFPPLLANKQKESCICYMDFWQVELWKKPLEGGMKPRIIRTYNQESLSDMARQNFDSLCLPSSPLFFAGWPSW